MQIATRAREATVAWFEKILLAPKKEAKTAEKAAPASAPKVNLSRSNTPWWTCPRAPPAPGP